MNRKALLASVSLFSLVIFLFAAVALAVAPRVDPAGRAGINPNAPMGEAAYATDHILIQIKAASMQQSKVRLQPQMTSRSVSLGLASVDAISQRLGAVSVSRPFIEPANTFEAEQLGTARWIRVDLPPGTDIDEAVRSYAVDPNVENASPDWIAHLEAVPTDPAYPQHWGHNNTAQLPGLDWGGTYDHTLSTTVGTPGFDTNAQLGWDGTAGFGSASVIIAIVDTGCNLAHPDLSFVTGFDYGDNDSNPEDNSTGGGHGTCCAGVAAAKANNAAGACGPAPGCKIMPMKAANSAGSLLFSSIVNCIYYAADHGANVISMSFGAAISSDAATDAAILYAYNAGVTLLAATGNENKSTISYPAINANVIGVGAASPCGDRKRSSSAAADLNPGVSADPHSYTCDGERWWGSNYGTTTANAAGAVDIIAPTILYTTDILGAGGFSTGDYEAYFNGTSCATPYAAGVCALIKSKNPSFTPAQVKSQLTSTAQDIVNVESAAGWDRYAGYGMVDINAAVGGGGGCSPLVTANFSGTPTTGVAPLTVNFSDLSTGSPTSWSWTFGDGGTSTAQNPSHAYAVAGTYNVSLTATNPCGSNLNTKNGYVVVSGSGPTWVTITSDNFETNFGTYTDGGTDCVRYTGTTFSHQGTASIDIQDNTTTSFFTTTTARNVSTYNTQDITFWFRAESMENGEDFWVQYFNGTSYVTVATLVAGTNFTNGTFNQVTVTLRKASIAFPTNARLRFRCDASDNNDDVYIDEVVWRGTTSVLQTIDLPPVIAAGKPGVTPEAQPLSSQRQLVTELEQNYPNPFNPRTTIAFSLAAEGHVTLDVFDVTGKRVASLVDGTKSAGRHVVSFEASSLSSGIYFYRLNAGGVIEQKKMVLLK